MNLILYISFDLQECNNVLYNGKEGMDNPGDKLLKVDVLKITRCFPHYLILFKTLSIEWFMLFQEKDDIASDIKGTNNLNIFQFEIPEVKLFFQMVNFSIWHAAYFL